MSVKLPPPAMLDGGSPPTKVASMTSPARTPDAGMTTATDAKTNESRRSGGRVAWFIGEPPRTDDAETGDAETGPPIVLASGKRRDERTDRRSSHLLREDHQ